MTIATRAPGKTLRLRLHSVSAELIGDAELLTDIDRDFSWFASKDDACESALGLTLSLGKPQTQPQGRLTLWHPRYRAYDSGAVRRIHYRDGSFSQWDYASRRGRLIAAAPQRLHELAYLALLSRAGEAIELAGRHRVHALGFSSAQRAGLVLLPEGGGKSVLALSLLQHTKLGLLSDDTPLVDAQGRAWAWPLRLGFRRGADLSGIPANFIRPFHRLGREPKRVVDVDYFSTRVTSGLPVDWLLLGRRVAGKPGIRRAPAWAAAAALADSLVLGRGIAQMSEYMLGWKPRRLTQLAALAAARARAARALLRRATAFYFDLGPDSRENAQALSAFL